MDKHRLGKGQYIHGAFVNSQGPLLQSFNPAYGSLLWQGSQATEEDILRAYESAQKALSVWAATPFEDRAKLLTTFAKMVAKKEEALALLIAKETGKPLWEALTETQSVINKIDISIRAYQERTWTQKRLKGEIEHCLSFKPQGVVLVLGAFNFPAHLPNGHIIPALLAGNTVLYKPSEQTPAVAEWLMQCWHDSGLPKGVMHCLQGNAEVGTRLLSLDIQAVYFTGSYATGLIIHQQLANRPEVLCALEMGGNNPLLVDIAHIKDKKAALYQCILSTLLTAGQRCTSARRLFLAKGAAGDAFLQDLIKAYQRIQVGPYDREPQPFMGPVISYRQAEKLLLTEQQLTQKGGLALLPMALLREGTGLLSGGIIDMTSATSVPDEEHFGPLVQLYRYDSFEEALCLANNTRFGLAASLLSDKPSHFEHFYQNIKAGLINWNRPTTGAASDLPFGGVGCSGNHRPSAYFAADYCAYPIARMEQAKLSLPSELFPGVSL